MSNETVREAIEDIALRPDEVELKHAKILRDEIIELRSRVAELIRDRDAAVHVRSHLAAVTAAAAAVLSLGYERNPTTIEARQALARALSVNEAVAAVQEHDDRLDRAGWDRRGAADAKLIEEYRETKPDPRKRPEHAGRNADALHDQWVRGFETGERSGLYSALLRVEDLPYSPPENRR